MGYTCIICRKFLAGMVSLSPAHQKLLKTGKVRRTSLERIWTFFPLHGKDKAICFGCLRNKTISRYSKKVIADMFFNMAMEVKWEGYARTAIKLAKASLEYEVRADTLCEIATLYENVGCRVAALKNYRNSLECDSVFPLAELVATNIERLEIEAANSGRMPK